MKHLIKTMAFFLLGLVLSSNLVMAETVTYSASTMSNKAWTISTSGTAPTGSSASCSQTYNTFGQATAGNSFTMTLSNFSANVTKLTFSLHSNASKGQGNVSYSVDGGTEVFLVGTEATSNVAFNTWGDNTQYGTDYRNVNFDVSVSPASSLVINVRCVTTNSIYFNGLTVTYTAAPSFTITAQSNNSSYGSASVSGTTITATPNSGYRVMSGTAGYTVTSGTATVTNNEDNTFTVTPSTNCTVQINFEEKGCSDHAGTNVTSGSSTSYIYGPVDPYYKYSTRQILYTKTDLGLAAGKKGTIKSIYFEYEYSTAMTKKTDVKIYMANTNLTALSTSAYVPYSDFTEVYSGALNCSNGWNEITLTTPFVYNGSGNLVVLIDDNSNAYEGQSYVFKYHTASTTAGAQIYKYSDSNNENPSSTTWSSYTATNYRPNTKFCIEEADMTTATVTWYVNSVSKHSQTDYPGTICTAPTTPTTSDCDGSKVFVGWTTSQNYESENIAPSDLFTDPTTKTIPDGGANYYAVFADASSGGGSETKSYGFEDSDDETLWIVDGPAKESSNAHSGSKSGKITTNNTYVQFKNKVKVTSFSYWFKRSSTNSNYNVYIETSTTEEKDDWEVVDTQAMSSFNNGSYASSAVTKTFDGETALYVRFHCYNTTATRYVDDISITYAGGTTYSDYTTTCGAAIDPVIKASDVNLAYSATSGEIAYTIDNPVEGKSLTASDDADWIDNIQVAADKVTFATSENTSYSSRSAEVTLSYEGANDKVITVTQAGKPDERKVVNITAVSTNAADNKIAMGATANVLVTTDQDGFASYTYSTSDANIATVNESGVITGVAKGTATITVELNIADDDANYKKGSTTSKTVDITVTRAAVEGELFYESFDEFSGTGGNDDKWSGSIASTAWGTTDNDGWTKTSGYSANQCAKFGAGSTQGVATTPEIDCQDAKDVTVTFKAGAWNNDSKSLTLEATNGTISQSSVTIANAAWTDCSVSVSNITGKLKITFKGNAASNSRFFLDEVSVIKKEVESVSIKTPPTKDEYSANETFDPTGLEMTITYKDNSTKDVAYADNPDAFTFEPSLSTALTAANTKVTITLDGKTAEQNITVNLIETSLEWSASSVQAKFGKDDNVYPTLTVSPVGLEGVTYESSNEDAATIDADGNITLVAANQTTTITAKYAGVENIYKAATDASYTLEVIEATAPTFDIDPTEIAYTQTAVGETYSNEYFALMGENLTENVTFSITGTDAGLFSVVDKDGNPISSITPDDGIVLENIYIQYTPTSAGPHTAKLTITSGDAEGVVTLSGDAKNKYLVKWSINGTITKTDNEYVLDGDKVTKVPEVVACTGNTFMGWTEKETIEDGQEPDDLFKDNLPAITKNVTYYAVYAQLTKGQDIKKDLDLSEGEYTGEGETGKITWTEAEVITIVQEKGTGQSNVNSDYVAAPRWYKNHNVTFTPSVAISKIEVTANTAAYANALANSTFTNATATGTEATTEPFVATITPTNQEDAVVVVMGDQCRVKAISVWVAGANEYKNYSTICEEPIVVAQPTITPSKDADLYFESITAEISCTTEGAKIYYSIDGTEPSTEYVSALNISETTTIRAIAKVGKYASQEATATYSFGKVYASLAELVAAGAPTTDGEVVRVTLTDEEIVDFYTNKSEVKNGVKLMSGEQAVEIYNNAVAEEDWVIGGTLSGTLTCPWKLYNSTWELCPDDLSDLTYDAPKEPGVIAVTVGGTATHTTYVEGETFDPAGLTVTATYDIGEPKDVTELATWNITPSGTLTTDVTKVNVKATYSDISDETGVDVTISVSAMQESTIANFISNGGGRCWLVGVVSEKSSNNFVLTDESGSIKIYGYSLAAGVDAVVDGDKIKVIASEYEYYQSKTHEAKNVVVIEKIKVPVTGVSIEPSSVSIKAGKTITLKASIAPENATDKSVTWTIINDKANDKITIDQTGLVTVASDAADGASATIKVTTTDGGFTATCTVTVAAVPTFNNGIWQKVEATTELNKADYYIIASDNYDYAMKSYESGNNCSFVTITKDGSMLTYETQPAIFQLEDGKNATQYAIRDIDSEEYLYAAGSGSSNYLKSQESKNDDKASWKISVTEGTASIVAASSNRNTMSFNNSNQPKIFSCYSALQTNGQLALYKYVAGAYVISFDANGGDQNTVPGSIVTNEGKATIPTEIPIHETRGKVFAYWTDDAAGEGTHYTAGQENCEFSANATLYAQWEVKSAHHITYVASGAAGEVPVDAENYYENDEVTLASASTLSNPGHNFAGWEVSYNDGEKQIISVLDNKFTMPDYDVTATAKWALKTNDKWVRVTNASQLVAGDKYVLACNSQGAVNGDLNGSYFPSVSATFSDDDDKLFITAMTGQLALTLGGETDAWTFTNDANKYLTTSSNDLGWSETETTWKIEITTQKNVNITFGESNPIKFNKDANPTRFKTYNGQTAIQLYRLIADQKVNGEVDASTLPEQANVTVNEGGNLVINEDVELGDIVVMVGGTVTLEATTTLTVNNFVIKSTMGAGKSGQVLGVTSTNFVVEENAYFDVTLGDNGNPEKWHAFAVPFNVDAINGVYDLDDNKLTNEVNYAIMDYHGDVRAQGQYGWKKFRGIMQPGVFYLMTVDGLRTTYRMKMNGEFHASNTTISVQQYAQTSGTDTDAGWNGIANNQLGYSSLGVDVQVLNPTSYTYEVKAASEYNFTVGTPFFYQASATGTIDLTAPNASENYAPRRVGAAEAKNIAVTLGNDNYTDRLYISATDEATNEYQIGHDLVKMTMTNAPAVPQIFAEAYGTKLCMVDAPMMYDEAVYALNLYAPTNGEYTIGAAQVKGYEVFLTQYGSVIWNLSMSEATIELTKGNNTEYGLILKAASGHAPTNINTINGQESVQKFLYNSNIYLRHNNKTFNVQGQLVK